MGLTFTPRNGCPLCGSRAYSIHVDFEKIPVFQCLNCLFIYSSQIMPPKILSDYYAENFGGTRQMQGQRVNARVNSIIFDRLMNAKDHREMKFNGSALLDVGTGYGFFLDAVRRNYRMRVTGVELSTVEANFGKANLALDIRNTALTEARLVPASYDVVTAFEVIEHIENPSAFVTELLMYVKPGGLLLIATDNFESAVVRFLGRNFPKWIPHTHVSHFSPETLTRVMKEKGLHILKEMSFTTTNLMAFLLLGVGDCRVTNFIFGSLVQASLKYKDTISKSACNAELQK